jgi:N-acetylglucosamine kinase
MAGVDRPEDHKLISGLVQEILPTSSILLDNDGVIALKGGSSTGTGIIVISGTGSIALGMNEHGDRARAGGWGNVLGDEGSGYSIALKGLRSVCRAHDGREPATELTNLITAHLDIPDAIGILGWIKKNNAAKDQIAALSRLVFEAAARGDARANQILAEEAAELALAAKAVASRIFAHADSESYEIVVAGGNLRHSQVFFDLFRNAVHRYLPNVAVVQPRQEPVMGAVLMALQDVTKA